jgi:hypothetical protein
MLPLPLADAPDAPGPAWDMTPLPVPHARFPERLTDHWRLLLILTTRVYLLMGFLPLLAAGSAFVVGQALYLLGHGPLGRTSRVVWIGAACVAGALLLFVVLCCLVFLVWLMSGVFSTARRARELRGGAHLAEFHRAGVRDVSAGGRTKEIAWGEVRSVRRTRLYLFLFHANGRDGVQVPLSAFTDRAAAERFHGAVVRLWKERADEIPDDVRREFAPPPPAPAR